jgi:hypothetical protein
MHIVSQGDAIRRSRGSPGCRATGTTRRTWPDTREEAVDDWASKEIESNGTRISVQDSGPVGFVDSSQSQAEWSTWKSR